MSITVAEPGGPLAANNPVGIGRKFLIVGKNLPVPLDRRVWLEATTLTAHGYQVSVICFESLVKKPSTVLTQEQDVGTKWNVQRGWQLSQQRNFERLCAA